MDPTDINGNGLDPLRDYFEGYEVSNEDLQVLCQSVDKLASSGLVEEQVLDEIRFVTYDSKYLYVFTQGEHASNERFQVEELPCASSTGLRLFKIPHSGSLEKDKADYTGATAWFLRDEVETTAVSAKKFPNRNTLDQPDLPQPEMILDVVQIPPIEAYRKKDREGHNYLTDMVFHEAGHIEHRRLQDWQLGAENIGEFPSEVQRNRFLSVVRESSMLPDAHKDFVVQHINRGGLSEMVAILIDSEAAQHEDPVKSQTRKTKFRRWMDMLSGDSVDEAMLADFQGNVESRHGMGRLLVHILEDRFPDFAERKQFVRDCLDPKRLD